MGNRQAKKSAQQLSDTASSKSTKNANDSSRQPVAETAKATNQAVQPEQHALTVDDFELIKVLGKGSFGKVMLVKKKDGGDQLYAMKTLRKSELLRRNQLEHTQTERDILQNVTCPFIVQLKFAFQTSDKLYMVLEYMAGGELFFWLKRQRRFSETRVRLYGAELVAALGCLHSRNIIYRDLKPENILLCLDGHLKITDFGLSKEGITTSGPEGGTKTFCGTPEYLAPEILENKGHGKAVDWWSLGTLLYEMLCGLPPFYDTNVQRMYQKIMTAPLRFPAHVAGDTREMLQGLLQRRINDRLGSGPGDAEELKRTEFFAVLDFARVLNCEYEPEFKPPAGGPASVANTPASADKFVAEAANFDKEFTDEKAVDSLVTTTLNSNQQETAKFDGFTFNPTNNLGDSDAGKAQAKETSGRRK